MSAWTVAESSPGPEILLNNNTCSVGCHPDLTGLHLASVPSAWDAVSQGSANRKEGHCTRKYNREMESGLSRAVRGSNEPGIARRGDAD